MTTYEPGHLFVLRGDLTRLTCAAVVVPTSRALQVNPAWRDVVPLADARPGYNGWLQVHASAPAGWGEEDRSLHVGQDAGGRQVWLARTDAHSGTAAWVAEGLVQAVRRAAAQLPPSSGGRHLPLVGVPLAGTGEGGLATRRGAVVDALVPALQDVARDVGVDVALVLHDDRDHTAVQARRDEGQGPAADALSSEQLAQADRLGVLAASGHLVLFLGAGVSYAAGLPTWKGLIEQLGRQPELADVDLTGLGHLDAAQVAHDAMKGRFNSYLCETFTLSRHALAHGLLASLDVGQVVTTNYDNGYELAAAPLRPQDPELRVLPRQHAEPGAPWLLKLHGDIEQPDSFVLTREQYVEYGDVRAPLTGLVQALLMTRHMLFVGFSLEDDNFARLALQVRRVLRTAEPGDREVGTVLGLRQDPARERLWGKDLAHVPMQPVLQAAEDAPQRDRAAARLLEVFLDRLAWRATTTRAGSERYLLDARYDAMPRESGEVELRTMLRELEERAGATVKGTPAWGVVAEMLRRLGAVE